MHGFELLSCNTNEGGIRKRPRGVAVRLRALGLEGDIQADTREHGGPDQALCLYAAEDYRALVDDGVSSYPLPHGSVGENLTTLGVDWRRVVVGQRYRSNRGVVIEISTFRYPCAKLKVLSPKLPGKLFKDHRLGAYARVIKGGLVQAGDVFEATTASKDGICLQDMAKAFLERDGLRTPEQAAAIGQVLAQPELASRTRSMFERLARGGTID